MPDHVYRIIEIAGSSEKSIEDAIQNAVRRASRDPAAGRLVRSGGDSRPHPRRQGGALPGRSESRFYSRGRRLVRGHLGQGRRASALPDIAAVKLFPSAKNCTAGGPLVKENPLGRDLC
jgi:dodecin